MKTRRKPLKITIILIIAVSLIKIIAFVYANYLDSKDQNAEKQKSIHTFIIENEELISSTYLIKEISGYRVFIANKAQISAPRSNYTPDISDFFVTFDMVNSPPPTRCGLTITEKMIQENGCKERTFDLDGQPINHNGYPLRRLKFKMDAQGTMTIKVGTGVT